MFADDQISQERVAIKRLLAHLQECSEAPAGQSRNSVLLGVLAEHLQEAIERIELLEAKMRAVYPAPNKGMSPTYEGGRDSGLIGR